MSRVKDGAIIVLHDSGSTPGAADDAPAQVVRALPVILDGLEKRGLKVVPLEEALKARQPGRLTLKKCVQRLWGIFEWTFRKLGRIREVEEGKNSFYRMAPRRYRGKEWLMPDGTLLKPGNTYLELHINNNRLQELIDGDMSIERIVLKGPGSRRNAPAGGLIEKQPRLSRRQDPLWYYPSPPGHRAPGFYLH